MDLQNLTNIFYFSRSILSKIRKVILEQFFEMVLYYRVILGLSHCTRRLLVETRFSISPAEVAKVRLFCETDAFVSPRAESYPFRSDQNSKKVIRTTLAPWDELVQNAVK